MGDAHGAGCRIAVEVGRPQVQIIPLDPADIAEGRALRTEFARFWSTEQGDPRAIYDRFIGATPIARGVTIDHVDDETAPGVWVRPADSAPDRALLFLHGGGYVQGSAAAYAGFVSQLATRAGVAAFALDYPLAPEAPFPAAFDLAVTTLQRLAGGHSAVAVAGDSAGGGLTLATVAEARRRNVNVAAVATFSPFTDLRISGASAQQFAIGDPLLDPIYLGGCATAYLGGLPPDDPRASPLFDTTADLPPLLIQVGSDEVLLDDSLRYADRVERAGGSVRLEVWQGMHHVFQLNVAELVSARAALDSAASFLADYLDVRVKRP